MQQNKSTKKTVQIEIAVQGEDEISLSIIQIIKLFKLPSGKKNINYTKRSGVIVSSILTVLLILPFAGASSIAEFFVKALNKMFPGEKDVYFRFKNNSLINWRGMLFLIAQRFSYLVSLTENEYDNTNEQVKTIKAIIFDDSQIDKTGSNIEGVGYVYDHCRHLHVLGFKILVCGFWDGSSFIPIDFSIHRENRSAKLERLQLKLSKKHLKKKQIQLDIKVIARKQKNAKKEISNLKKELKQKETKTNAKKLASKEVASLKLFNRHSKKRKELQTVCNEIIGLDNAVSEIKSNFCGLKPKEYKNQFRKTRDRNSSGYKRKKEADQSKMNSAVKMLKRAIRKGFAPDYVLTDTWFFCKKIIEAVIETQEGVHLVSMAKIGVAKYKDFSSGKFYTPSQLIAKYERKNFKKSRKYKAMYIPLLVEYQGIKMKIFLIKFGKGRWRMLVSTKLNITFAKIIEVYKIRWTIEVFFKECKQYLLLGKCQSRDFDAQIADATLSMIRYIMLSYYQKLHYGTTIGGMFRVLEKDTIRTNILTGIKELLTELFKIFAEISGTDYISLYEDLLRSEKAHPLLIKLGWEDEKLVA